METLFFKFPANKILTRGEVTKYLAQVENIIRMEAWQAVIIWQHTTTEANRVPYAKVTCTQGEMEGVKEALGMVYHARPVGIYKPEAAA